MNASNYYVSARELFLLCVLRKDKIQATNEVVYEWTFCHHSFVEKQLSGSRLRLLPEKNGFVTLKNNLISEAKKIFKVMDVQERNFIVHEHDLGFSLVDHDEDLSWFDPRSREEEWSYNGQFKLTKPLSEKELYIIKSYR